jgi:hypothetical protein
MTAPCSAKVQARAQVQQRRSTRVVVTAALADNRLATGFAAAALAAAVLINAPMAKADLVSWGGLLCCCGCRGSSRRSSPAARRGAGPACRPTAAPLEAAPTRLLLHAPQYTCHSCTYPQNKCNVLKAAPLRMPAVQTEDLLARSTTNKALNDKKRLATSYSNFERRWG